MAFFFFPFSSSLLFLFPLPFLIFSFLFSSLPPSLLPETQSPVLRRILLLLAFSSETRDQKIFLIIFLVGDRLDQNPDATRPD